MFKRKRKITKIEVVEDTSKDMTETINNSKEKSVGKQDTSSKFFSVRKKEKKTNKELEEGPVESTQEFDFIWTISPEYEEKVLKENKKKNRGRKNKKKEKEVIENTEERKDISTYFEANQERDNKKHKKSKVPKSNKKSKRKSHKQKAQEDIKNQKVFKYNKKKYTKVEDFITYLNEHYLDIEKISKEVLDDENFFGWINKNSGMFNQSLIEYKEIKEKIENKS